MQMSLILLGALCIIAAIIGGGVEFNPLRIPKFESIWRQALLAGFGVLLIVGSLVGPFLERWVETMADREASDAATNQIAANEAAAKPAAETDRASAGAKPRPARRPPRVPDQGLTGEWRGHYNVEYQIVQNGTELYVAKPREITGLLRGDGTVRGDRLEWMWGDLPCSGTVAQDRQSITMQCREGTNRDVLRRVGR